MHASHSSPQVRGRTPDTRIGTEPTSSLDWLASRSMPWTSAPSVPVGRRAHFRRPFPDVLPGLISGDYDGTRILPHTYEALLVVLPASRFYVHARGMAVYAAPGDICIGNVRELHGADAGDARCQARFFLIAPDLLHELSSSRGGTGVMTPCFDGAPILDPPLARALAAMWEEVERPVIASDAADSCRALLRQLVQRYARDSSAPVDDDRVSRAIRRVMEYLQRHVTECVALQELAEVASVSKGYLAREFHRVIGLPPHAYHVQLRIARAARLLAMGTSLSRVALDAGFADQSHLSRKFKTAYGVTPLAFARAVRSRPLFSICTEHIVDGITGAGKRRSRLARSHLSTGDAAVESALRTDVAEQERCNFVQECR